MNTISTSQALQIAGRAGRYGTQFSTGSVTTMKAEELPTLKELLSQHPEPITQVGLHPTAEQIELYAYHLPNASLSNLIDIFVSLSTMDNSLYFMCSIDDFKFLADMIQHVSLPLRDRYVFCCAPINRKSPFICSMFLKFARRYSNNEALTFDWLCRQIGWPFVCPNTLLDLVHLESVFDVLDLYLWLSYRFQDLFPEADLVRDMQKELDCLIQEGVTQLTRLLVNSETGVSSGTSQAMEEEDTLSNSIRKNLPYYLKQSTESQEDPSLSVDSSLIKDLSLPTEPTLDPSLPSTPVDPSLPQGRISKRLLEEGLLTPKLLEDLQKEWLILSKEKAQKKNLVPSRLNSSSFPERRKKLRNKNDRIIDQKSGTPFESYTRNSKL